MIAVSGFMLSFVFMFFGWNGCFNYFTDKPEIWFQRSGSLMALVLFISDYNVYKLSADIVRGNMMLKNAMKVKDQYRPFIKPLQYLSLIHI